jgi:hypothetical protein
MFKEIAIDPDAASTSFKDFNYIIEMFGISEGRLIAAFPSKWKRLVHQAAERKLKGTLDLSKIQLRLSKLSDPSFIRKNRPGNGCDENWLQAALKEHERLPFDGIISTQNIIQPPVAAAEDLYGDHPLRAPNRQWHVLRRAKNMGECCAPVLCGSKHIKLIDPHFDAGTPRFQNPFVEFMKYINPGAIVDIFRGDVKVDADTAVSRLNGALKGVKPIGVKVRLFLFDEASMHNRFVISEIGGLGFHTGLDEDWTTDLPEDLVHVLQEDIRIREWSKYKSDDPICIWD